MASLNSDELTRLGPEERLASIGHSMGRLWDSLHDTDVPLPEAQQAVLARDRCPVSIRIEPKPSRGNNCAPSSLAAVRSDGSDLHARLAGRTAEMEARGITIVNTSSFADYVEISRREEADLKSRTA
jgi:hypothetical protein